MARIIQSDEKQGLTTQITISSKAIIQNGRADTVLPRQGKTKGIHHHQAIITRDIKETYLRGKKIKNMNIKKATNPQLSTTESKK